MFRYLNDPPPPPKHPPSGKPLPSRNVYPHWADAATLLRMHLKLKVNVAFE